MASTLMLIVPTIHITKNRNKGLQRPIGFPGQSNYRLLQAIHQPTQLHVELISQQYFYPIM